jgi:2'-5' RNA ligase
VKGPPAALRLFFALWPDDSQRERLLRERLLSAIRDVRPAAGGRAVPTGNLHVTLAFLGNVAPERVPDLRAVAAARVWPDTCLVFDRLAWWPKARLLCLEAQPLPPAFAEAVRAFHEDLRLKGFSIERRPFRAHITVARNVASAPVDPHGQQIPPISWPVQEVVLVASTPTPDGSVYRVLAQD